MVPTHLRAVIAVSERNHRFDTVIMGRSTYEPALAEGVTSPYPHLRQVVVSTTLPAPDPAVEVYRDRVRERVRDLKAQDGKDIWLAGGGRLATSLVEDIDEVILKVNPFVLGAGRPCSRPTSARGSS